ncbi:hypothetical protein [Actinacidiphila glaucinigra]|uniref:hypothetical protein n=1 Tax=Actinacidiphila glaucinigra TaxID=235986 RepID=UPI0036E9594C
MVTPTDAGGERLAVRAVSAAPTLGAAAEFGSGHRTDYVSVRHGETITVGGSAKVNRNGIACVKRRLSLPWESISAPQRRNSVILRYQKGVERLVLTVPLSPGCAAAATRRQKDKPDSGGAAYRRGPENLLMGARYATARLSLPPSVWLVRW